uniref:(northern house mosquito) hypothetical protein n=1 Tax=Culex pipiens TaxID=7175 RepID=A0A8D8BJH7_CULPI
MVCLPGGTLRAKLSFCGERQEQLKYIWSQQVGRFGARGGMSSPEGIIFEEASEMMLLFGTWNGLWLRRNYDRQQHNSVEMQKNKVVSNSFQIPANLYQHTSTDLNITISLPSDRVYVYGNVVSTRNLGKYSHLIWKISQKSGVYASRSSKHRIQLQPNKYLKS